MGATMGGGRWTMDDERWLRGTWTWAWAWTIRYDGAAGVLLAARSPEKSRLNPIDLGVDKALGSANLGPFSVLALLPTFSWLDGAETSKLMILARG